ncbi:MAG TPA: maleylpyruvate isomerase family mycothiol-dependent enzyme [Actinomycetes bacterium]|jgi:uncharacterized protein (TIGR03083 family)|nr:maleylpyruvate isomerase family mycothiol-dependent enzyme [Actinomycetes bacterium]
MTRLGHDRYCDEVVTQTNLLRDLLEGSDLSVTVPTTPDWTLAQLVRHVGGNLRSVETAVRTGTAVVEPDKQVPEAAGPAADDPAALDAWLAEGAARFAGTLRGAGPAATAQVWAFQRPTAFWARRAAHDLVIHRADAAGAVRAGFTVAPDMAADAIDELLELLSFLRVAASSPRLAELRGPGKTIHLHATDTDAGLTAEWLVELGTDGFTWRHAHDKATVVLRGPLADVLLVFYRRLPADSERVEVLGEAALLDFWLERVALS